MSPEEIHQAIETLDTLRKTSQYSEAKAYAYQLISQKEIQQNPAILAKVYIKLGVAYKNLSDNAKALEYYQKALSINEEIGDKDGIARNLGNIGNVFNELSDYPKALEFYRKALQIFEEIENKHDIALSLGNIGMMYWNLSDYTKAIEYYQKAMFIYEEIGNNDGLAINLGNIGLVYLQLLDYPKALNYYEKALFICNQIGNKEGIARNYGNIGNVYSDLLDYPKSLEYFQKALLYYEQIENKRGIAINLGNIGIVYKNLSDYSKALEFYQKSLLINEEIGRKEGIAINLVNIGSIYASNESQFYDNIKAEEFLQRTVQLAEEISSKNILEEAYKELHYLRINERNFEDALHYHKKSISLKEEIQTIEAKKQAERFDIERKDAEREKLLAEERGRFLERESILRNILPDSVTERLVKGENPIADHFESVSVLFMDLVGFTSFSSNVPPKQLVYLLDSIFSKADEIVETFGLEKIKTIGDGYLAVANVTRPLKDHQVATAKSAIYLMETLKEFTVNIP
ncbi:MAG: tetratricopeptide repeat protein, partial [Candidatus Kapabacteria bacterium]|nr:tetratricopeptide repeat protein [Candidatus Kapabacteria bacterium]